MTSLDRRGFLSTSAALLAGANLTQSLAAIGRSGDPLFRISLAEWSLHKELQATKISNLDFPKIARELGIEAVEYVNTFFRQQGKDREHWKDLRVLCGGEGVKSLLIMCDGLGDLGDPDPAKRTTAVTNHELWLEAAKFLGCHSIRVNAASRGSFEEQQKLAADGLRQLTELGAKLELNVIVENHGGLSSNGKWLAGVMKLVDHPRCGTLPDFGNFRLGRSADGVDEWYDRYKGVEELMPFAKAVSAKSHDFDDAGNETRTDYARMLAIVVQAGYRGYVGIEYEGDKLPERQGIAATRALLERVRAAMEPKASAEPAKETKGGGK